MATSEKTWDQLILLVISAAGNGGSQALSNTTCTFLVLCRNLRGKIHIGGKKQLSKLFSPFHILGPPFSFPETREKPDRIW